MGEGWHNNHHAFPTSARHGLRWWQIDLSYYTVRVLEDLAPAWKVRVPSLEMLVRNGTDDTSGPRAQDKGDDRDQ